MSDDYVKALKEKTARTAGTYFGGYAGEVPYNLWAAFDKNLAKDLSLFITGQMYSRERIPHKTRQMVAVAALTALDRVDELRLHLYAALNVGCTPQELAEVIFQVGIYGGMPVVNRGLGALQSLLEEQGRWPLAQEDSTG